MKRTITGAGTSLDSCWESRLSDDERLPRLGGPVLGSWSASIAAVLIASSFWGDDIGTWNISFLAAA
ncbi:MAG: hypothetical protein JWO91_3234 [Acidobacteriaceae bacterium]|nr:hypothetical protein [Acidobacteriaceae bacterium]